MVPLQYEGDIYRPPSEAKSLILQATIGCSYNRCTFCSIYKKKKFRVRTLDEIKKEIAFTSGLLPHTRRVFLADGNALVIPTEQLLEILQSLDRFFPNLERVSVYGNTQDLLEKNVAELKMLRKNKLDIIYLGIESGSAKVLMDVKKGVNPHEIAQAAARAKEAEIPLSVTVINGLAGVEGSEEHARETACLLNKMDPEYLGLLSLITVPGTTIHRQFREGKLTPLSPWELLHEIKMIVEGLSLTNCVFRANHASNYLPLKATLPRDKNSLLVELDKVIKKKTPGSLKSELFRGL